VFLQNPENKGHAGYGRAKSFKTKDLYSAKLQKYQNKGVRSGTEGHGTG
jgi:hypothetical protein